MAEQQDKQYDPSPKRLQKARDQGNVFKSQEAMAVGMLLVSLSVVVLGLPGAFDHLQGVVRQLFAGAATTELNTTSVPPLLVDTGYQVALMLFPFFGVLLVAGVGFSVLQSGWHVTTKPLAPKTDRISPFKGLKRIFSSQGVFTALKSVLKIAIVAPVAYVNIRGHLPEILMLHTAHLQDILGISGAWIVLLVVQLLALLAVLSAVDVTYEKWRFKRDLKMTKQEVKDEAKESEGNPELKQKLRQRAREIVRRPRLDHAVLKADVVITNPTHYAVALCYDPSESDAPRVLVKGIRKRALRIKELAREHGIPTIEDRPLARALYGSVDEMQEIPEELYPAVAAILAEIYRKQGRAPGS